MKNDSTALALAEIQAAKTAVTEAEQELDRLMSELQAAARADKTTISAVLHNAFQQVRRAREHLVALEKLARAPED